jgi:hypothetical protein
VQQKRIQLFFPGYHGGYAYYTQALLFVGDLAITLRLSDGLQCHLLLAPPSHSLSIPRLVGKWTNECIHGALPRTFTPVPYIALYPISKGSKWSRQETTASRWGISSDLGSVLMQASICYRSIDESRHHPERFRSDATTIYQSDSSRPTLSWMCHILFISDCHATFARGQPCRWGFVVHDGWYVVPLSVSRKALYT